MKRAHDVSSTVAVLVSATLAAAAAVGCGGSGGGMPMGVGGAFTGVGGVTGIQGTGGRMTGTGGLLGAGGKGTGGLVLAGTGGNAGILGRGGNPSGTGGRGTGGNTTLFPGTGGRGIDAGAAGAGGAGGTGTGGRGTGGRGTGGVGGAGTGGATASDGGVPDAAQVKCSDLTTQAACDARAGCHSVFVDPGTCGCAPSGCCARFDSCADGDKADCTGPALCKMKEPFCESPYTIAFEGSCYEGCVKQTDCALPACPQAAPANASSCGLVPVTQTCYYEDCAGAGRTIATCTPGEYNWKVTTTPCTTVPCDTDPASGRGITCAEGKVCIIAGENSGGIAILPVLPILACVDHTCGKGPITTECISSSYGPCTPTYSAAGAVFRCEL
jgi:hypothetical protein